MLNLDAWALVLGKVCILAVGGPTTRIDPNPQPLQAASNLVQQYPVHLGVRYAQVAHGDAGFEMVEPFGKDFEADAVDHPLNVPERLAKSVRAVIALQVDGPAP